MRIAVLGGGIAGLAAAFHLGKSHEVTLFEKSDRLGGHVRTGTLDECLVEWGPNGFLDSEPATRALGDELGLRVVGARAAAARRFVWRAGRLRELPRSPGRFLLSDCLPLGARLRALLEPFAKGPPDGDESVRAFAARRLGEGAADVLVDAFVTGVFAGDPARLSVASAFPRLEHLESEHGSLLRGAKRGGFGPRGTLTSFQGGMEALVRALAERVDARTGEGWETLGPNGYDRVVCTVPPPRAAALAPPELAAPLKEIVTAPVAVVATVFDEPLDVPDAFGFLVPFGQGLRILGTLYESSIFPGRAPAGRRLFRTMVGGRRDPGALDLDDGALLELALRDLGTVWGTGTEPRAATVIRHPVGIAQYELGHADRVARIEGACPPWLRLAGSGYRGVSLNLCVKEALGWTP